MCNFYNMPKNTSQFVWISSQFQRFCLKLNTAAAELRSAHRELAASRITKT